MTELAQITSVEMAQWMQSGIAFLIACGISLLIADAFWKSIEYACGLIYDRITGR